MECMIQRIWFVAASVFAALTVFAEASPFDERPIDLLGPGSDITVRVSESQRSWLTTVDVTGRSFTRAIRFVVPAAQNRVWDAQLAWRNNQAIKKGDVLQVSFWMRAESDDNTGDRGQVHLVVMKASPPWTQTLAADEIVGTSWHKYQFQATSAADFDAGIEQLAFQAGGKRQTLLIADLKWVNWGTRVKISDLTDVPDVCLDLSPSANMGWRDDAAGDGKGGWSDQGSRNDFSGIDLGLTNLYGVTVRLLDPEQNIGRGVLTFRSSHLNPAIDLNTVDLTPPAGSRARFLYLLHTACWVNEKENRLAGTVRVELENGLIVTNDIRVGVDVADWWNPFNLDNGRVVIRRPNASASVGIYLSRIPLSDIPTGIKRVTLSTAGASIWIVAAATLSSRDVNVASPPFVVSPGSDWRPVNTSNLTIMPGSALDFSSLVEPGPAGKWGRVISGKDGRLYFEKRPNDPVRFFGCSTTPNNTLWSVTEKRHRTQDEITSYAEAIRLQGYNLLRLHFLEFYLMMDAKADFDLNPRAVSNVDWLIASLKERGIYLYLDGMTALSGWRKGSANTEEAKAMDLKSRFLTDPATRKHWIDGINAIFLRTNMFTQTRLIDDPQVAAIVYYNEQDRGVNGFLDVEKYKGLALWRNWLKSRYHTTEAFRIAWGADAAKDETLENAGWAASGNTIRNMDRALFLNAVEGDMQDWYSSQIKDIGGLFLGSQYDMYFSLRNLVNRARLPQTSIHSYFAHWYTAGNGWRGLDSSSSTENAAVYIRDIAGTRLSGIPLLVTEYGHCFWNRFRHEEGLVMGGYAALQDWSLLMAHAEPVLLDPGTAWSFMVARDPIGRASQVLTALAFARGDVAPAPHRVEMRILSNDLFRPELAERLLDPRQTLDRTKLALLTRFSVIVDPSQTSSGATPADIVLNGTGKNDGDILPDVTELRRAGILPSGNQTDPARGLWQSETGEIILEQRTRRFQIITPRLEGCTVNAGNQAALAALSVNICSEDALVAAASLDKKRLTESERILVVLATDALNSGMEFASDERGVLKKFGSLPVVLKTVKVRFTLKHRLARSIKAWTLGIDGKRTGTLTPSVTGGGLTVEMDTATLTTGPSMYIELAVK